MSKIETAKAVKVGVKRLDWILKLAAELEVIGSMENAEQDAQKKLDETYEALAKAQANVDAINNALKDQNEDFAHAKSQHDDILAAVKQASDNEVDALKIVLGEMTTAANAEAVVIVLNAQKAADAIKLESEDAQQAIEYARESLMTIKEEHAGVKQGIASAKAAAKAAMQEFAG